MSEKYAITDLLEELKKDDSWETDPEVRQIIADALYIHLVGNI